VLPWVSGCPVVFLVATSTPWYEIYVKIDQDLQCTYSHLQVTLCLAVFRDFPWKKVPIYMLAQLIGAWLGALIVFANYFHAINIVEGGKGVRTTPGTASLFATYSVRVCSL